MGAKPYCSKRCPGRCLLRDRKWGYDINRMYFRSHPWAVCGVYVLCVHSVMSFFQDSTGANIHGSNFIEVGRGQIGTVNMFGHTKSTKQEPFRSFHARYSHDSLQLSMKYLLPSSVLHISRDHLEPTATRALEEVSSKNLRDGLATAAADRFVGSAAPRVMENQPYHTPSLNTMIRIIR